MSAPKVIKQQKEEENTREVQVHVPFILLTLRVNLYLADLSLASFTRPKQICGGAFTQVTLPSSQPPPSHLGLYLLLSSRKQEKKVSSIML